MRTGARTVALEVFGELLTHQLLLLAAEYRFRFFQPNTNLLDSFTWAINRIGALSGKELSDWTKSVS